jgi:hypothetical protein
MIDKKTAHIFVKKLATLNLLNIEFIRYEIQDHWPYFFVCIDLPPHINDSKAKEILISAQELAKVDLPWCATEYFWMISLYRHNTVVNSVFGGDLSSPNSGEI